MQNKSNQNKCCCCPEILPPAGPCPASGICNEAYAQLGLISNAASGSLVSIYEISQAGGLAVVSNSDTVLLQAGYVYYVSYTALATPEINGYFQTQPYLNGAPRLNSGTFSPTNSVWRNASTANSFLVTEAMQEEAQLQIRLDYADTAKNIDLSGSLIIFPIAVRRP